MENAMASFPSAPHMDQAGLDCFKDSISRSRCYIEYGSGGSTAYAVNVAKVRHVISVETDLLWIENLRAVLKDATFPPEFIHVDIGPVGEWGYPKSMDQLREFWKFTTAPWSHAKDQNLSPDLVLIDGRFRVSSFLYSLLCLKPGATILFDDYLDRPHYHCVEQFSAPEAFYGRMAKFIKVGNHDLPAMCAMIVEYSINCE